MIDTNTPDLSKRLPRGALATPRHELAAAVPYTIDENATVPSSFLMWPSKMASWNNYLLNDCVSAEEAFAKATAAPQVFLPIQLVVNWATTHNYLNGASIHAVLQTMQTDGFQFLGNTYNDGPYNAVNWTDPTTLQSAIVNCGPVKLGIGGESLQSNCNGNVTPGTSGWALYNYPAGLLEDHCVSLCGYGSQADMVNLFAGHGINVVLPPGMPTGTCYAMFTWNSIGIIDEQSMLNMTYEAWVRNPVTEVVPENISLKCLGTDVNPAHVFLNGGTQAGNVNLAPNTNTASNSGTHWKAENLPDGSVALKCLGSTENTNHVYLNGGTRDGSVGLAPNTDFNAHSGTHWEVEYLSDGSIAFKCLGSNPNADYLYLDGGTADGSVSLAPNTNSDTYSGTHWDVGILSS